MPVTKNSKLSGILTSSESAMVFGRKKKRNQAYETIGLLQYNLTMGVVLLWGFALNFIIVEIIPITILNYIHPLLFFTLYFVGIFYGAYVFSRYDNPLVSFLGYNLVVMAFGFGIKIILIQFDYSTINAAMRVTAIVTGVMIIAGTLFPNFFIKIHWALFTSLISFTLVELTEVFIFKIHHDIINWVMALIYCGYIGLDWGRAYRIPKTVDNAIDSAAALYMDIVVLFIRILSIFGKRRK